MKVLMFSIAMAFLAVPGSAFAEGLQSGRSVAHRHRHHVLMHPMAARYGNGVAANGRCGGISYGTGARRCDSMSGGPSGGLTNRN